MTYNLDWLINKFDSGETIEFVFFQGHTPTDNEAVGKFVFNQWFCSPFKVDKIEYKTAGHWMMAHKAMLFNDNESFDVIINADKTDEVKEIGRQIRGFDEVRWNENKYEIVRKGNIHKFRQNKILKDFLLATAARVIVEASPTDKIWGIGHSQDSNRIDNPHTWSGLNLLGFALMETRDFLNHFGDFEYANGKMLPPWRKYPTVQPLDGFWRMDHGEQYIIEFGKYFQALSDRDKIIYELSYPATGHWLKFFKQ